MDCAGKAGAATALSLAQADHDMESPRPRESGVAVNGRWNLKIQPVKFDPIPAWSSVLRISCHNHSYA
jgi:hypothetical protein